MEIAKIFVRCFRLALAREAHLLAFFAFAALCIAGAQFIEPILFGRVIDTLSTRGGAGIVLLWAGLGLVNAAFSISLAVAADRMAHRQRMNAMNEAFEKTIQLPYSFHSLTGSGKVVRSILAGADQVFFFYLSFFRENLIAFVGCVAVIPLSFFVEPHLALVLCALALVFAAANYVIIRRTHRKQAQVELRHQEVAARLVDVMANVTIVRSFTRYREEAELFQGLTNDVLRTQYPVLTWWGVLTTITRLSSMTAMVTIVGIGSMLVHKSLVSPGQVVTFVGFSTLLISRLDQFSTFLARVVAQAPTLKNLFDVIDNPLVNEGSARLSVKEGRVEFENVTFQYRARGQGIFNLNFVAEPGETVALVGPSGSGKTTCLSLLQRLYTPSLGRILIDGVDIGEATSETVCSSIAAVFQDAGLFNRSIYENILVGRPTATREEVEAAARRADAHEFIMARAGGYDFVVGERGLALSGGERQRVAIARAILKDAPILVLDEATSALDNETEKRVQQAMDELRRGKTTFVIAHRLSTIVEADKILVMNGGRIEQAGSFAELTRTRGLFKRLLEAGQLGESPDANHEAPQATANC